MIWGSVDVEIQADEMMIPEGWTLSQEVWGWKAFEMEGIPVLRVWKEKDKDAMEQDSEKEPNLARGMTLIQDGRAFTLPETFLQYLDQTHQNTVTLIDVGKHFEIWPEGDYQRMLDACDPMLFEFIGVLKNEKFE